MADTTNLSAGQPEEEESIIWQLAGSRREPAVLRALAKACLWPTATSDALARIYPSQASMARFVVNPAERRNIKKALRAIEIESGVKVVEDITLEASQASQASSKVSDLDLLLKPITEVYDELVINLIEKLTTEALGASCGYVVKSTEQEISDALEPCIERYLKSLSIRRAEVSRPPSDVSRWSPKQRWDVSAEVMQEMKMLRKAAINTRDITSVLSMSTEQSDTEHADMVAADAETAELFEYFPSLFVTGADTGSPPSSLEDNPPSLE